MAKFRIVLAIGAVLFIFALSVYLALPRTEPGRMVISTVSSAALLNLNETPTVELLEALPQLPPGAVFTFDGEALPDTEVWFGDAKEGYFLSALTLPEHEPALVVICGRTTGQFTEEIYTLAREQAASNAKGWGYRLLYAESMPASDNSAFWKTLVQNAATGLNKAKPTSIDTGLLLERVALDSVEASVELQASTQSEYWGDAKGVLLGILCVTGGISLLSIVMMVRTQSQNRERGASLVEFALLVALIGVVTVVGTRYLGRTIGCNLTRSADGMTFPNPAYMTLNSAILCCPQMISCVYTPSFPGGVCSCA